MTTIEVGSASVTFSKTARNLGAILDRVMDMKAHVNSVCRSGYIHIRTTGTIRHLLPQKVTEQLTHTFVTSRLDNCNSLMCGLPAVLTNKLQRLQNTAARRVTRIMEI